MKKANSVLPAFIETHLPDLCWQLSSQRPSRRPEYAAHDSSTDVRSVPEAISVVIPTLNEAANMADLLVRIHQSLTAASICYEVIVIDDHSTDETIAVVQAVAKEHALPVRVLSKQGQTGKSYSLLEGFAAATFDVVAMIDADLQYPPEALAVMAQMLTESDIVVADRRITNGGLRGLMSQVFRTLTKLLFGINTDMQSGLKMFRHSLSEEVSCCPGRWSLDLYLVTHALFHGYRLSTVSITFQQRQRGASKVAPLKVALELLLTMLTLKVQGRRQMQTNRQKDLDKQTSSRIMDLGPRLASSSQALQATENEIPREGDVISRLLEWGLLSLIFVLSILMRLSLYKVVNGDYTNFLQPWYDFIKTHGGFAAFKSSFSDYNPAYLYLLALTTYLPVEPMAAIKGLSMVFDLVMALFTILILRLRYQQSYVPILGALTILLAPTIFINSAAWAQCDAIYTSCCLGSLYFLLSKRPSWACVCFGLAISFKAQAIFFLPVLIVLFLTRKLAIKSLILIPVVFLALLVPAYLAGRDAWSLLTIYLGQANEHAGALTLKAPTIYQWIPANDPEDWVRMGMILAIMVVTLISYLSVRSRKAITAEIMLKLTLIFALAIPFFLPEMHERYFYLADVVSIIYAFCFPRYFYVAIIEQLCSCMSVIPSLFSEDPTINLAYVAFAVLFLIVVTFADLIKTLFSIIDGSVAIPSRFSNDLSAMIAGPGLSAEGSSDVASPTSLNDGLSVEESSTRDFSGEQKEGISETFSLQGE